jgi:flagellin
MHELAVDSNDATKTNTDRQNVQAEFVKLQDEIKRITESAAKYNGGLLFDNTYAGLATQVGADSGQVISITLTNFSSGSAALVGGTAWSTVVTTAGTAVSTASDATTAITNLTNAINGIAKERAGIGAQQERFEKTRAGLLVYEDQIRTAESKIRSVDVARESSEMMKYQILSQIGTAMLAQANQLPAASVQLVG